MTEELRRQREAVLARPTPPVVPRDAHQHDLRDAAFDGALYIMVYHFMAWRAVYNGAPYIMV